MERLRRFLHLPDAERWLLVKVICLLSLTWVALHLLPFDRLYRLIGSAGKKGYSGGKRGTLEAEQICAAVNRTGRNFLGKDSCFPEALVGEMLLRRNGHNGKMRIGVIKDNDGSLHSHAWVEINGAVVIGGPPSHVQQYMPLPDLDQIKF